MRLTKQMEGDFICKNCGNAFKYKFATDTKVQTFLCHCKKCKKGDKRKVIYFDWDKARR